MSTMLTMFKQDAEMVNVAKRTPTAAKIAERALENSNLRLDRDITDYLYKVKLALLNFFNQYKRLDFNLKYYSNKKLIGKLPEDSYFRMKKYNFVSIGGFTKSKDPNAKRLLQKLHSNIFKVFYFGHEFNPMEMKPFSYYKKEVMKILPKVSLEVCISGCVITKKDLLHIIHSSSECKALKFKNCVIQSGEISIKKSIKFKTNLVEFDNCKSSSKQEDFMGSLHVQNLLQAMLECSLAQSLISIKVSNCGATREDFLSQAEELNHNGVKIYDGSDK
ncbi:unnamed protein product [Moneuplotes crassus]|uniref:Uncharacterized protein n=1 Tax=Euplotes crassus TaxID=5936 RepID=A0AAD2D1Z3_EUPCR|nr:unnamed protein product [Moneuplotes crassus]